MFAVRNIFSQPGRLQRLVLAASWAADAKSGRSLAANDDPLGFLFNPGGRHRVVGCLLPLVRHEPGVDVLLFARQRDRTSKPISTRC